MVFVIDDPIPIFLYFSILDVGFVLHIPSKNVRRSARWSCQLLIPRVILSSFLPEREDQKECLNVCGKSLTVFFCQTGLFVLRKIHSALHDDHSQERHSETGTVLQWKGPEGHQQLKVEMEMSPGIIFIDLTS